MQLITISHLDDSTPWSFFCPVTGSQLFGEDGPETEPKSVVCSWSNDLGFEAEQFSPELKTAWKAFVEGKPGNDEATEDEVLEFIRGHEAPKLLAVHIAYEYGMGSYFSALFVFDLGMMQHPFDEDDEE